MRLVRQPDPKQEALRTSGTLNPYPKRVTDVLFQKDTFFDPRDVVQVKYEMLRCVHKDGVSVQRAAIVFGFSRMAWYQIKARYESGGLAGLLPQPRGPKPHPKKRVWCSTVTNSAVIVEIVLMSNMSY